MIWFLLVNIVSGQPQLTVYQNELDVCAAYAANQGSHVYQVTNGRKVDIAEGDCKPVVQFKTK
jgi:hypothetical protein